MADNGCKMQLLQEAYGIEGAKVEATAIISGDDIVLVIGGGTKHHIGAVSLALPRPSLADPVKVSASASVLCVTGHKEDELARSAALEMAAVLNRTVTVVAGIHIDKASKADIHELNANCDVVIKKLIHRIQAFEL